MAPHPIASESDFKQCVDRSVTVADFYAPWCGACKKFMPDFEAASAEHADVQFLKVDVDEFEDLAAKYEVSGLPHLVFFQHGQPTARLGGRDVTKKSLDEQLAKLASGAAPGGAASAEAAQPVFGDDFVQFVDPSSGNTVRMKVQTTMQFAVNGEDRPPFDKMISDGASKLAFPTIGKAVTLPPAEAQAINAKLITLARKANVRTDGFNVAIPDVDVSYFSFVDPESGNTLAFSADMDAEKIRYQVNGKYGPSFATVQSDGYNRVSFVDVQKGCTLPEVNLHVHIASLLSLVKKVGGKASGFPSTVKA
ncbi:Thioredoxin-2 [Diplonema papillatum]|nr:Thioredoxin-2 [Diplonema papillatum]